MKALKYTLTAFTLAIAGTALVAQDTTPVGSTVTRRRPGQQQQQQGPAGVTERMQGLYDQNDLSDADVQWMRIIYRELDLDKDKNAPLYFPEEVEDGNENLFRIIMRLLADNNLRAYEYLDGREMFTEKYQVPVKDILDRFYIIYEPARGSSEKNPKFVIDESDVPANEVLSYYIIEKWIFDTRNNRLRPSVEAICPVLHRSGDFGGDAIRYPMFWIKMEDLRPHLALQPIFINDDNNLPTCTYDDFFTLTMYEGDIYKTRNLKNKSMAQLYPDPEDRKRAQDSIQARLDHFEDNLWTPTREELLARAEQQAALESGDSTEVSAPAAPAARPARATRRSTKKPAKIKESPASRSAGAARSVRRRK
ncbi:MAG: gliding motility protein GldN [Odoribacter sp.]|nr:gliding motility protein GldN [Odoribacter sp.]